MEEESGSLALSNAEIGKAIVDAAKEARRKRHQSRIVQIADSEMESVSVCQRKIDYYTLMLKKSHDRLAAIEKGEFTISEAGAFQFNDTDLRITTAEDPVDVIIKRVEDAARRDR